MSEAEFAERRLCLRYPPKAGIRVSCHEWTLGLGRDLARSAVEISETGLRLVLSEPVERGQVVEIRLLAPGWLEEVKRLGIVMWTQRTPEGGCRVGIQLSLRLSHPALRDLCIVPEV